MISEATPTSLEERGSWLLTELESLEDSDSRDLGVSDLSAMRAYLNSDLYQFARVIFGYRDLIPSLHGDMAAWISLWGYVELEDGRYLYYDQVSPSDPIKNDYRRLMTQIPRDFFKTSLGTRANALWQLCKEPHKPVAIFNERAENARKWLGAIQDVITGNKLFQDIYKDLLPPGVHHSDARSMPRSWKWNDLEMDLEGKNLGEPERSLSAHGVESATTGGHWPKLILDDLISVKHKQSQAEMERAKEWVVNHVYLMRPAENSLAYVNCTPWTYTDIYRDLLRDYGYKLYRRAALENQRGEPDIATGASIFPGKLSTEQLQKMYNRDPFSFSAQMMAIPKAGKEQSFQQEWIRFGQCSPDEEEPHFTIERESYDPSLGWAISEDPADKPPRSVPLHQMSKLILLDPAPTEDSERKRDPHARNAMLVEGIDPWGRRYILEAWAERCDYMDVITQIFTLSRRWGAFKLAVEEVNFSNVYRKWVRREQEHDGRFRPQPGEPHLSVMPLKPARRDKDARILSRVPAWRQGLYYVNRGLCSQFLVEYSEYPNAETKDLMDAMGYDADPGVLIRPETLTEMRFRRLHERRDVYPYSTRDEVTGY